MDFPQFIAANPELTPFAREMFLQINARAEMIGAAILATRDPAVLRSRSTDPNACLWLNEQNRIMADALDRDLSGRLAAVPGLRAWASAPGGVGNTWLNWWVALYKTYLDHIKQPTQIAAE
jgi:hypothetical protein